MEPPLPPALQVNPSLVLAGGVKAPQNGEEFLANVIVERMNCKDTVSVPIPLVVDIQTVFAYPLPSTETAPVSFLPTLEWQNHQIADFSELRLRLARIQIEKDVWIVPKIIPHENASLDKWIQLFETEEPLLSQLFAVTQNILESMLEVLGLLFETVKQGDCISKGQGKWLFAALAMVKLPLRPNLHALLRNLARLCSQIRSRLSLNDENLSEKMAPLNLFLCLISRYFGQKDLADNQE